jgi:hypothetical protein
MSRSTTYAFQSIAASGLAVMSHRIAFQLRGDLWSDIQGCLFDFKREQKVDGARRIVATFPSYGEVLVYARSLADIEKRLEWIVGEAPKAIVEWKPEVPAVSPQLAAKREANRKEVERLEGLRKLATEDPPSHDCSRRREILEARRELGMQ